LRLLLLGDQALAAVRNPWDDEDYAFLLKQARNRLRSSVVRGAFMTGWKTTLIASLIGTGVGFWAWKLGLTKMVWPEHPQLAGFFLTLITTIAVQQFWPTDKSKTSSKS
jgi:hypothetical protein